MDACMIACLRFASLPACLPADPVASLRARLPTYQAAACLPVCRCLPMSVHLPKPTPVPLPMSLPLPTGPPPYLYLYRNHPHRHAYTYKCPWTYSTSMYTRTSTTALYLHKTFYTQIAVHYLDPYPLPYLCSLVPCPCRPCHCLISYLTSPLTAPCLSNRTRLYPTLPYMPCRAFTYPICTSLHQTTCPPMSQPYPDSTVTSALGLPMIFSFNRMNSCPILASASRALAPKSMAAWPVAWHNKLPILA